MKDKILILGKGRIGKAIFYYLRKFKIGKKIAFFEREKKVKNFDIIIGALPGKGGEKCLALALKYKKDLLDLTDLEPKFYLKKKNEIAKKKILVIPGCGFCPGLINLVLGWEIAHQRGIRKIEIKAGTLSPHKFFFPFLWNFEDLILEHQIFSWQKMAGKKKRFSPFAGYQKEKFFGILAESYFAQSGFENLMDFSDIKNFQFRLIRPFGFFYFFQFLKNQGFLRKENFEITKRILEGQKEDNLTLAEIKILTKKEKILWQIKSFSKKGEIFNSMQKVTAFLPVFLIQAMAKNKIKEKKLIFAEEIAQDKKLFEEILEKLKKEGILIKRKMLKPREGIPILPLKQRFVLL